MGIGLVLFLPHLTDQPGGKRQQGGVTCQHSKSADHAHCGGTMSGQTWNGME